MSGNLPMLTETEPPPADGESTVEALPDPLIVHDLELILAAVVIGLIAVFAA